jgi:hypothetical protein
MKRPVTFMGMDRCYKEDNSPQINAFPIKIPTRYLMGINRLILKCVQKVKDHEWSGYL